MLSIIAILRLKSEKLWGKFKNDTELDYEELENELQEREIECLWIRGGELYLETVPQLVFQFTLLPIAFLWEHG